MSTAGIKSRPALFWDVMPCVLVKRFQKFRSIVLVPSSEYIDVICCSRGTSIIFYQTAPHYFSYNAVS